MLLKHIHVSCVVLTFLSFSLRGIWMLSESTCLKHPLSRTIPHIIDTTLLLSGIAMVVVMYRNTPIPSWLQVKMVALVIYIILGSIALTYGRTKITRVISLAGAWLVFFYIITVAVTKSPWLMMLPS